jgi:hypothetical protein
MGTGEIEAEHATRLRTRTPSERAEAVARLEVFAERVVEACDRYDELVEFWEDRDRPDMERLLAVLSDPNVRREKLELAVVGLSLVDRARARAALRWFEPMPGQPRRIEDLAKVALFEWRSRWADEEKIVGRSSVGY